MHGRAAGPRARIAGAQRPQLKSQFKPPQSHACGPANILGSFHSARAVRSDTEHASCDARHETAAGAAPCIRLSCPITRQTIPDPPDTPTPTWR
eukprot:2199272-Prymnesium_polylepis.1